MAELKDLLATLLDGKREQDARFEALLAAINNPPAPAAATVSADQVMNNANLGNNGQNQSSEKLMLIDHSSSKVPFDHSSSKVSMKAYLLIIFIESSLPRQ